MKYTNKIVMMLLLLTTVSLTAVALFQRSAASDLEINLSVSNEEYVMGEIVDLSFEVRNISGEEKVYKSLFSVGTGTVQLHVSADGGKSYKEYIGPGWGLNEKSVIVTLQPGQVVSTNATMLWNYVPKTKGLSEDLVKEKLRDRIGSHYAFDSPGEYHLKAVIKLPNLKESLESKPVVVTISEPIGGGLEVWNRMKNRSALGYFIQYGSVPSRKYREAGAIHAEVKNLLQRFPQSPQARSLKRGLLLAEERKGVNDSN